MTIHHRKLMELAGIRSKAGFKELRDLLGIGRTDDGTPRRLGDHEAFQVLLVSKLQEWGLTRFEAAMLARAVKRKDLVPIVADEAEGWLLARHDPTGQAVWVYTIMKKPEDVLECLQDNPNGLLVIPLLPVVRKVFFAAMEDAAPAEPAKADKVRQPA